MLNTPQLLELQTRLPGSDDEAHAMVVCSAWNGFYALGAASGLLLAGPLYHAIGLSGVSITMIVACLVLAITYVAADCAGSTSAANKPDEHQMKSARSPRSPRIFSSLLQTGTP